MVEQVDAEVVAGSEPDNEVVQQEGTEFEMQLSEERQAVEREMETIRSDRTQVEQTQTTKTVGQMTKQEILMELARLEREKKEINQAITEKRELKQAKIQERES